MTVYRTDYLSDFVMHTYNGIIFVNGTNFINGLRKAF